MAFKITPYAYGPAHLQRLAVIRDCRALDVPLAEVRRLLDYVAHPDADCGDINRLIDEQLGRPSPHTTGELNLPPARPEVIGFQPSR